MGQKQPENALSPRGQAGDLRASVLVRTRFGSLFLFMRMDLALRWTVSARRESNPGWHAYKTRCRDRRHERGGCVGRRMLARRRVRWRCQRMPQG
jgi:hypothetical protein